MNDDVIDHPLLEGVVGSTAYGLATPESDEDRLGIFARPTEELFGLSQPRDSIVSTKPDSTWHEAAKALRLILACNPTAMEILWLESYDITTPLGLELVEMRSSLLSAGRVRHAYLGYATQQLRKLQAREVNMTAAPSRTQSAKHARHLIRLLYQASELHRTGKLTIRLDDPDYVRNLAEDLVENPSVAEHLIGDAAMIFDAPGVLPAEPDTAAAVSWLKRVRREHYRCSHHLDAGTRKVRDDGSGDVRVHEEHDGVWLPRQRTGDCE